MNSSRAPHRAPARRTGRPPAQLQHHDAVRRHFIGQPLSRVLSGLPGAVRRQFRRAGGVRPGHSGRPSPTRIARRPTQGSQVSFPGRQLPLATEPLLQEPGDLDPAALPKAGRRATDERPVAAVRLCAAKRSGGEIPVMGWVEGALAEAADVRGDGPVDDRPVSTGPSGCANLLETCVEARSRFARAQVAAGADIIGLGDAVASQVSPADLPRVRAALRAADLCRGPRDGRAAPGCTSAATRIASWPTWLQSGADIIDLDWMVDMRKAAEVFGDRAAPCGNHDPVAVMLNGTPETVRAAVRRPNCAPGGPRCISMAGCEIPDGTPHANLCAHRDALEGEVESAFHFYSPARACTGTPARGRPARPARGRR